MRFAGSDLGFEPSDFWNDDNLSGKLGSQVGGEQASVTIVPSRDSIRVYEKNDGDPSLYIGDSSNPNESRRKVDSGEGYAYPRENKIGVKIQEMTGRYTDNGNNFATVDTPTIGTKDPGLPETFSEQQAYRTGRREAFADQMTNDWMKGVNMYDVPRTEFKSTYPTVQEFGKTYQPAISGAIHAGV